MRLSVVDKKRRGGAGSNLFSRGESENLVATAAAIAKMAPRDKYLGFATAKQAPVVKPLKALAGEDVRKLDHGHLEKFLKIMADEAARHKHFVIERIDIDTKSSTHALFTTRGARQKE